MPKIALKPLFDNNTRVLVLGSMPGELSLSNNNIMLMKEMPSGGSCQTYLIWVNL